MSKELLLKSIHLLLAKSHLHEAGVADMTVAEYDLLCKLGDWYESKGKLIAESRRLTQMRVVLD